MTIQSQNLGFVQAIHVGGVAPTNTNMLWRDTSTTPHTTKLYDTEAGLWRRVDLYSVITTYTQLAGLIQQGLIPGKQYIITDASSSTKKLLLTANTSSTLYPQATDLDTGQSGVYNYLTDTFVKEGVIVFKKSISAANILAGGFYEINELPAVPGHFWNILSCFTIFTFNGVQYDGEVVLMIQAELASRGQWFLGISNLTENIQCNLQQSNDINYTNTYQENSKMGVSVATDNGEPTVGDGTFIFYGSAILIPV